MVLLAFCKWNLRGMKINDLTYNSSYPSPKNTAPAEKIEVYPMKPLAFVCLVMGVFSFGADGWMDRFQFNGDFRLRYEVTDFDDGRPDLQRTRIRYRLNTNFNLTERWTVGLRGVSGNPDDHRGLHQTIDDGNFEAEITLDRAFIRYQSENWMVEGGQFQHPFLFVSSYPELSWDHDIQPKGLSSSWTGHDYFFGHAGYYLLEDRDEDSKSKGYAVQFGGATKGKMRATWALAYYDFEDDDEHYYVPTPDGTFSNLELQGSAQFAVGQGNLVGAFQYMYNPDALTDRDTGWVVSLTYNQDGLFRRFYIEDHRLEQESILEWIGADDYLYHVNFRGWAAGTNVRLWRNGELHVWALSSTLLEDGSATHLRYRADLNIRF